MPLEREIERKLLAWKEDPAHRALLVEGARQVGKTYSIRRFAARNYESFLEVNFIETPSAASAFEGDLDAGTIVTNLTALTGKPLVPGRSLVFLDEIQECPRARTAIKFLVDDGRFDYVESGSLLGVTTKDVPSYPVGYESTLRMFPLTLAEFFAAVGVSPDALGAARAAIASGRPVPALVHERLLRAFRVYLAVGGMPAAVQSFAQTHDVARALGVQRDILALYRRDASKYASNPNHVRAIFDAVPSELDKKDKRFKLASLAKSARMERYGDDFLWLADAGCALPCFNVDAPVRPLALNEKRSVFKLYANDVGLLAAAEDDPVQYELINGDAGVNWGSILENAVAQELAAKGYPLRYFDRSRVGEVDFLVSSRGFPTQEADQEGAEEGEAGWSRGAPRILPIEVKSGKDYRRHKALDNLMAVGEWRLDEAVVLCQGNVEQAGGVTYLPWYALAFMEPARSEGGSVAGGGLVVEL